MFLNAAGQREPVTKEKLCGQTAHTFFYRDHVFPVSGSRLVESLDGILPTGKQRHG